MAKTTGGPSRFDHLQELKQRSANPFNVNVVRDGCQLRQPCVTNLSAVEMQLTEMQEDLGVKDFS